MIGRPRLGARATWIAAAAAVLVAQATLAVGALVIKHDLDRRTVNLGCNVGPVNMASGLDRTATAHRHSYPYGTVTACQVLHKKGHLFGDVEATTYLLLDTDQGAVAVRVEYRDLADSWPWTTARAFELTAEEAADVVTSEVDRQRVRAGIDSRGGARAEVWSLESGV
jgi:hypothetical protein